MLAPPVRFAACQKTSEAGRPSSTEFSPVVVKRRPAPAPLLDERRRPRFHAVIGVARHQLGGEPGALVIVPLGQNLGPVHAGGFQLLGSHVMAERRRAHAVEIGGKPPMDLGVVEPFPRLGMHLGGAGRWSKTHRYL